jgi:metal-responsive CopG/Arc/MetJ family transcriptional regulator
LKSADSFTGFRLPKTMLAAVDAICAKHDLTRSQFFRRSVVEYLTNENASNDVNRSDQQRGWPAELFEASALKV